MKVEVRSVGDIKPYDRNPRVNDDAVDAVAVSIKEFGFRVPLVVDGDGVLITGHTRLKAAIKLGMKNVPVHVAADLTPEQARAYRIADNKLHELSSWDKVLLPAEIAILRGLGFDTSLMGFSAEDLNAILAPAGNDGRVDPDDVPDPPNDPVTKRGDLIVLGQHRLLCGDSSIAEDVDRLLDGEVIHLVNTDPPYNVKVEPRSNNAIAAGNSSFKASGRKQTHHQKLDLARHPGKAKGTHAQMRAKDRPLENDFVTAEAFDEMLLAWFGNASRVLKPGGSFYIWGGYANLGNYPGPLKACGLYFSQGIVWDKQHPVLTRKDFMGAFEICFYGWKEGAGHKFYGPKNARDMWVARRARDAAPVCDASTGLRVSNAGVDLFDIRPVSGGAVSTRVDFAVEDSFTFSVAPADIWRVKKVNPQSMVHLTEKPVELARLAIEYSSRPGEHVLDLFGGSGSTLIAAEMTGRRAYLMEFDQAYCDVIVERWEKFTGKKAVRHKVAVGADQKENGKSRRTSSKVRVPRRD